MRLHPCLFTLAAMLPATAIAQPVQGLYIGGAVGANFAGSPQSAQETTKIDTGAGPVGLAAIGWGFGNGLRIELEGSDRANGINAIATRRNNGSQLPLGAVTGTLSTYAVMANVDYDIPFHPLGLQPYVGAGAGYGWFDLGNASGIGLSTFALPNNNSFGPVPAGVTFGSAGAFAYQAMAGVALPLAVLPGLSLTFEYRFFGMARADVPVNRISLAGTTVNGGIPSSSTHNGFEAADNAILLGVRYNFRGL